MKIKDLNIIEFGGLSDRSYSLSEGLNIFEGENETGKSTLWLFIKFMLYGIAKKGSAERERSVSRTTHRAAGTMTLSCEGIDYRIERTFAEGSRGKVVTYRLSDGEQVFSGSEPGEAILGVPREIFDSSVGIAQSACSAMGGEKGAAAIRNILSSADESVDIERIEKRLEAVRVIYRHKNGKGGKLYELSEEINNAKSRLSRATEGRLQIADIESRLAYNTSAMATSEEKLATLREALGTMQKQEIAARFDRAALLEEEYGRAKSEYERVLEKITVGGRTLTVGLVENARAHGESLDRAKKELEAADLKRKELEARMNDGADRALMTVGEAIAARGGASALLEIIEGGKKKKTAGAALAVAGGILAAAFGALSIVNLLFLLGVGVSAILLAVGVVLAVSKTAELGIDIPAGENPKDYFTKCAEAYERAELLRGELDRAEEALSVRENHCELIRVQYEQAAERIGCPADGETVSERIPALLALLEKAGALKVKADELSATLGRERELLSAYDENTIRDELNGRAPITEDYSAIEEKKRFCEASLKTLKQRDTDLRTTLINLKATSDDPAALSDRISELQRQYDEANEYYEAVVTATEGLRRAAEAMRGSVTPIIGRDAARIVGQITDGRYDGLGMGRDMSVSLSSSDGLTTTYDMMSGGMRDAAYIALRISLMMRIFENELPTVMMDEALCQIDDGRMKKILSLLARLCADGLQVLLFTCHGREAAACAELGLDARVFNMTVEE